MLLKKLFYTGLTLVSLCLGQYLNAQAPSSSSAVMLQGFYWNSTGTTSWSQLNSISSEISKNFDMIWLPPSAYAGTNVSGYMPKQWSNQNSNWGTETELKTLISNLKANGTIAIADIVINHRDGKTTWNDFYADDFGTYGNYQLTSAHICSTDECVKSGYAATGNADTGDNYAAARDLDHTNTYVQNDIISYLKWMKNEIGYGGWRYDLVKGYAPSYTNIYNNAAAASISVGEYWDSSYDNVWNWVKGTNYNSMAFDFPGKYAALNNGLASSNYAAMAWTDGTVKRPAGLIHSTSSRRYAVTFVDNHDTYDTADNPGSIYSGNIPQAYAFILSSPGIPCVFYPHWISYKTQINNMIAARKAVGLTSESDVTVTNTSGYYEATSIGTKGTLITRIGSWSGTPSGYSLNCNGDGWAMYTKMTSSSGTDTTSTTNIGTLTIRAKVPSSWSAASIWVWDANNTATNFTGGTWPGKAMTLGSDGYYYISLTNITASKVGVVINNGATSNTKQTLDLTTTSDICWDLSSTTNTDGKYTVTENTNCQASVNSFTIKVKIPSSWSAASIWAWDLNNVSTNFTGGTWPGKAMTLGSDGYYYISLTNISASKIGVVINNGSTTNTKQTIDLTTSSDICWDLSSTTNTSGKYTASVSSTCGATSKTIRMDLAATDKTNEFSVYPNPVDDVLHILSNKDIYQVVMYNLYGKEVLKTDQTSIIMSAFASGTYIVKVIFSDKSSELRKVVKK